MLAHSFFRARATFQLTKAWEGLMISSAKIAFGVLLSLTGVEVGKAQAQSQTVSIILVRHPESDTTQPTVPLTPRGEARAAQLIHTLSGVKFTHVFASHTIRSRQTVERVAAANKLTVVQLPTPGSTVDGKVVDDQTNRRAPIEPVSDALLKLPAGSVALAGLNSENIYAILNKLGVPVAAAGQSCAHGSMCVPCTNNECYPRKEFDHFWHVVRQPGQAQPLAYLELRYAAGWQGP